MAQSYSPVPAVPSNQMARNSLIAGIVAWTLWLLIQCFNWSIGIFFSALTFGVSGLLCGAAGFLPIIPWGIGIVAGHMGLSQIGRTNEAGKGMAIVGLVLGYLGVLLTLCTIVFYVLVATGIVAASFLPTPPPAP